MSVSKNAGMTLSQLRQELRLRGAKTTGKKSQLIERLDSYDRNANFGHERRLDANCYNMPTPDPLAYKDINTNSKLPAITEEKVLVYLTLFGQELRSKAKDMYLSKFLKSIRLANEGSNVFIRGRVSAEMTKKCIYNVDVKLDKFGVVQECQCECAAGLGPEAHCKHVAVVLYALTQVNDGIITTQTCTQKLQTFHQAKKYSGSPVKTSDLILRNKRFKLASLKDFDPRPEKLIKQPEYPAYFRNVWINSSSENPSIRQLYPPANIYPINNDHDYLDKHPEDLFLDATNITCLTDEQQKDIEIKTRGQSHNKHWGEERLLRLQSSNFGRICKATDKTDFEKLAKSFTILKTFSCDATKHGRKYEATALDTYQNTQKVNVTQCGIFVSQEVPFLGCSPDGLVGDDGLVEVKCPYSAKDEKITQVTVPYLYTDSEGNLNLKINHDYYFQIMGSMMCTCRHWCDFVVWTLVDTVVIRIQRDNAFIEDMKKKLVTFFGKYFRNALLENNLYKNSQLFLPVRERF